MSQGRKRLALTVALLMAVATALAWVLLRSDPDGIDTRVLGMYRERWFLLCVALTYLTVWILVLASIQISKRRLVLIVGINVGLLLSLVAAESLAYFGVIDYRNTSAQQGLHDRDTIPDERLTRATMPNLRGEGTAMPNLVRLLGIDGTPVSCTLRTDEFGFRNDGDKTHARILCLGDSQLVGGILPAESLLTVQLEKRLAEPVMNLSEAASCAQEQLIRLESTGIDLKGKLVVHFISESTDLGDSYVWRRWLQQGSGDSNWPQSGLLKTVMGRLHRPQRGITERSSGVFTDASGKTTKLYFYLPDQATVESKDELPRLMSDLREWRQTIERQGGQYLIALVPSQIAVLHDGCTWPERSLYASWTPDDRVLATALRKMCDAEGIRFLDLTPALRQAADEGRFPYSRGDTHIDEVGHSVVAEAVADWIGDRRISRRFTVPGSTNKVADDR